MTSRCALTKCMVCGREAIFLRNYSGETLCKRCYIGSIEKKVKTTISCYNMFDPEDRIAVAVSGGKDSLSLLHILHRIELKFPRSELVAITVNEGISGYREEAIEIASGNCKILHVEHVITSFKELYGHDLDEIVEIAEEKGDLSPCSYCGVLRRKALNMVAKEIGSDKLAIAHTLDDEAQTGLLNVIHGDISRIGRVGPVLEGDFVGFVSRVKPLCEVPEREVALFAFLKGIEFQSASCPYRGEALRNDIRIFLNRLETEHPGIKYTVLRSLEKIAPSVRGLAGKAGLKNCKVCGEPTVAEVCKACQSLRDLGLI